MSRKIKKFAALVAACLLAALAASGLVRQEASAQLLDNLFPKETPPARREVPPSREVAQYSFAPIVAFDCVAVADVLYLLPLDAWPPFLRACRELLAPGGRLLLKEAEDDGGWRAKKALVQEWLMVRVLRRTQASGGLGFQPRAVTQRAVEAAGLRLIEAVPLARGYTTPHVLFVADRV